MMRTSIVAVAMALSFLGCGGADGGADGETCPPGTVLDVNIVTNPVRAGGGPVEVVGGLSNGCQVNVNFSLSGPGTLNPTVGIPVYYTPPATVASTQTATITATAAGLTDSIVVTINP
ncbi:MAG TPA: hypothetical protein VFM45_05045 [Anaeromyxobacteraceae bacterium]|nr:hypothetical protein [Anaeromyxobacteraceae bacterium]